MIKKGFAWIPAKQSRLFFLNPIRSKQQKKARHSFPRLALRSHVSQNKSNHHRHHDNTTHDGPNYFSSRPFFLFIHIQRSFFFILSKSGSFFLIDTSNSQDDQNKREQRETRKGLASFLQQNRGPNHTHQRNPALIHSNFRHFVVF